MNEPKVFLTGKEMSRMSKMKPEDVKTFLSTSYKNGPLKHGFTEEHRKLLLAKLCTLPEKIQEFGHEKTHQLYLI